MVSKDLLGIIIRLDFIDIVTRVDSSKLTVPSSKAVLLQSGYHPPEVSGPWSQHCSSEYALHESLSDGFTHSSVTSPMFCRAVGCPVPQEVAIKKTKTKHMPFHHGSFLYTTDTPAFEVEPQTISCLFQIQPLLRKKLHAAVICSHLTFSPGPWYSRTK